MIRLSLKFEGAFGETVLSALFDNAATHSYLHPDYAIILDEPSKLRHPLEVATASEGHFVKITEAIRADFYFEDIRLSDEFMIVPGLSEQAIIGVSTMQKWRIKLDFEHDSVIIDPKVAKIMLKELK